MRQFGIKGIEYYLPEKIITNEYLEKSCNANRDMLNNKIGILERRICNENEAVSDIAYEAAIKLFANNDLNPEDVDLLLVCTQNPDYKLPTTACILQNRLKMRKSSRAFDVNLGCSGFVYSLTIAGNFIRTGDCSKALIIMADAYSKIVNYKDKTTCTLFGDAAASALLVPVESGSGFIDGDFGTDGAGADYLIVPAGGSRTPCSPSTSEEISYPDGNIRSLNNLQMDGRSIFKFVMTEIPGSINNVLTKNKLKISDIKYFIFHQANKYILEELVKKMQIPKGKILINMEKVGNTVSASIPIVLKDALNKNLIKGGDLIVFCGFGVGLSWGSVLYKWID